MSDELVDQAFALSQRLFALWSREMRPNHCARLYRVSRRAADRAMRRAELRALRFAVGGAVGANVREGA